MTTTLDQAPALTFDPQLHAYQLDGRELPSVTTVLQRAGLVDGAWFTEQATLRGTYVHLATELHAAGTLDPDSVDPVVQPYLDAYMRFLRESGAVWAAVEQRLGDDVLGYAGTIDRVGSIGDQPVIVDIKTGPPQPWHALQLAAYLQLVKRRWAPWQRYGLWLQKNGSYRLKHYSGRSDYSVFQAALTLAQFKEAHGCSSMCSNSPRRYQRPSSL